MGVGVLHSLARSRRIGAVAWTGMACYWTLDIAAFYGALRFIGVQPNLGETIIAYATGYALTRRSMPFGGAGVTEALMTFSLYWRHAGGDDFRWVAVPTDRGGPS